LGGGSLHERINRFPEQLLLKSDVLLCFALLCCALLWDRILIISKEFRILLLGGGGVPWAHETIPRIAAAKKRCFALLC